MAVFDLHNHTKFSYDGTNTAEEIIENAVSHSVDIIGITDHQFSIGGDLSEYKEKLQFCKKRYESKIRVLCGLEIGTRPSPDDLNPRDTDAFDYVLFESLDDMRAMNFRDFLLWRREFKCPCGLAHCNIWRLAERYGVSAEEFLRILKQNNLFWEINTSGNYIYYYDVLTNPEKQKQIKNSRITLSVGSDTHWIEEYRFKQLRKANSLARKLGNPLIINYI